MLHPRLRHITQRMLIIWYTNPLRTASTCQFSSLALASWKAIGCTADIQPRLFGTLPVVPRTQPGPRQVERGAASWSESLWLCDATLLTRQTLEWGLPPWRKHHETSGFSVFLHSVSWNHRSTSYLCFPALSSLRTPTCAAPWKQHFQFPLFLGPISVLWPLLLKRPNSRHEVR